MTTPWLHVVGIGADGFENLDRKARSIIENAQFLIGGRRHLDLIPTKGKERIHWQNPIAESFTEIETLAGRSCAVIASGDPMWFGVGTQLIEHFGSAAVKIHPSVSSIQLACAQLGWTTQETSVISLHGRPLATLRPHLRAHRRILVLSGPQSQAHHLKAFLQHEGFAEARITVLAQLGSADEHICEFRGQPHDPLAILAVETGLLTSARVRPWLGMPDDAFEHDGKITKAELRAAALAKLAQAPGGLLWDIGAGSGAVGIEWLLSGAGSKTVAVERRADRAEVIRRNAALFALKMDVIQGEAPEVLDAQFTPDAIFIGGGLSEPRILQSCLERLQHLGVLVAHAVTLESETTLLDSYRSQGGELTRIGIDRARPVGGLHGWRPAMRVLQYSLIKQ